MGKEKSLNLLLCHRKFFVKLEILLQPNIIGTFSFATMTIVCYCDTDSDVFIAC